MSEQIDGEIKRAVTEASGEPRPEVRTRALEAMSSVQAPRAAGWLRWAPTAVGIGLVVAALVLAPYRATRPTAGMDTAFAAQQAMAAAVAGEMVAPDAGATSTREALAEPLSEYAERAAAFVREHHPDDPEMLIAAGMLTRDLGEARRLLKSAVELSGSGVARAAYAQAVMEEVPVYDCVATWGVDPADAEAVAEAVRGIRERGVPESLTTEEAEHALTVLKEWQRVEPENAFPFALAAYCLYGVHGSQGALPRWEEVSSLSEVQSHAQELHRYTMRLLERMGMSPVEAFLHASGSNMAWPALAKLRQFARIGLYEGRLAELEGRDQEAILWWMATFTLGENMERSSDTLIAVLVGMAIKGIAASPVWVWHHDRLTGLPDGPLLNGRYFHGKSHTFFVEKAGQRAADEIRDGLVKGKVRSGLSRDYTVRFGMPKGMLQAMTARSFAGASMALLVAALLAFAVVSIPARRRADEATRLSRRGRIALALLSLVPLPLGFALAWTTFGTRIASPYMLAGLLFGGLGLSFLLLLTLPLAAAFRSPAPEAGVLSAWRGNLRKVLPLAMVALAVVSLGSLIAHRPAEAWWVRNWMSKTEIEHVAEAVGPKWHDPPIPADAWRNEPLP